MGGPNGPGDTGGHGAAYPPAPAGHQGGAHLGGSSGMTGGRRFIGIAVAVVGLVVVAAIVVAIACGATVLSHVNDSGFWLVGRFLGMDEKTTLKTWTVMETLIGVVGFIFAFLVSAVL